MMKRNRPENIRLETEWIRLRHLFFGMLLGVLRIEHKRTTVTIRHEYFVIPIFLEMQCWSLERARRAIAHPSFWGWNGELIELVEAADF